MKSAFPDVVRIEVSGVCNFRCRHCPNGYRHSSRGLLTVDLFQRIVDQFSFYQYIPRVVVLYHGGEPLLNRDLPFFIAELKKRWRRVKVRIVTNASLLTYEIESELARNGLDEIEFSFDGISPEENNRIRQHGDFSRDSGNALRFLSGNHDISVAISNTQICTREEIERFLVDGVLPTPDYLLDTFSDYLDRICFKSYPAMVWPEYQSDEYGIVTVHGPAGHRCRNEPCEIAIQTCTILSDGDIVPCCYDITGKNVFGNISEKSILDIWNAEEFVAFRSATGMVTLPKICQKCFVNSGRYLTNSG